MPAWVMPKLALCAPSLRRNWLHTDRATATNVQQWGPDMTTRCSAWTQVNREYAALSYRRGGNQCSRPATYVDGEGRPFCKQHAKVPATVLRKATGKLRDGMKRIAAAN